MATKKLASMTLEEKREYKRTWYQNNKQSVQKERLINKGLKDADRHIKPETLSKYGISIGEDNEIVLPVVKPKYKYTESEKPLPNVINIIRPVQKPIQNYNYANTALTGQEILNFIETVFINAPANASRPDGAKLSTGELNQYRKIPEKLFKIYKEPEDFDKDLTEFMTNPTLLIKAITEWKDWKASSTKAKELGRILRLSREFPPLKSRMSENAYQILDKEVKTWDGVASLEQKAKTDNTLYYSFDVIKKEVLKKYKKNSYENLFVNLYSDIVPRDDLNLYMAYSIEEMTLPNKNYLLFMNDKATIHMRSFKTVSSILPTVFVVSKDNLAIIKELHSKEKQPVKKLFPHENLKLGGYMNKFLTAIPLFANEAIDIVYMRHSKISTEALNYKGKPNYATKMVGLANRSLHSANTQGKSYISRIKDAKAVEIFVSTDDVEKANTVLKETVNSYGTRSKT